MLSMWRKKGKNYDEVKLLYKEHRDDIETRIEYEDVFEKPMKTYYKNKISIRI